MQRIIIKNRLGLYLKLIRIDKPIGILLLLWPTLTALWLASDGKPTYQLILIFCIGTIFMRSAGCAINDFADRDLDKYVKRTAGRPLAVGKIATCEAVIIFLVLTAMSALLLLKLNTITKELSIAAVIFTVSYLYVKRFFAIPQAYLGIAFGFGIPMSFAAVQGTIPGKAWLMLIANIFWTIAYDTEYAMVDREDDIKINIKTSAITFGHYDVPAIMLCYVLNIGLMFIVGWKSGLRGWFSAGIVLAACCAVYHYYLIRTRERSSCFSAFQHNSWLGGTIFLGVVLDYICG